VLVVVSTFPAENKINTLRICTYFLHVYNILVYCEAVYVRKCFHSELENRVDNYKFNNKRDTSNEMHWGVGVKSLTHDDKIKNGR